LLADAAVLPGRPNGPFLRFTPPAAQRSSDSTRSGILFPLISRVVFLCHNARITDVPRPRMGAGNFTARSSVMVPLPPGRLNFSLFDLLPRFMMSSVVASVM
jgi:hypothetical protein